MADWFHKLGQHAGVHLRKGRWVWESLTGTEAERLAAEEATGRDMAAAFREQMGIDAEFELAEQVQRVGQAMVARVRNKQRRFTFTVLGGDDVNAFALPGGHVFITRRLIDLIIATDGGEAELAFILGHEMGHVIKEHPMERMMSNQAIFAAARAVPVAGMAGQWIRSAGAKMLQSAYSKEAELVADRMGGVLSRAAGFDAMAGVHMLERLKEHHGKAGDDWMAYFNSHPPFDLRIKQLRTYLQKRGGGR
ncbi:MAG: M48 family metallopeptidase [Phycisphaeraceae bacterium]